MTVCSRCHRPLRNPPVNGMGPTCAKRAPAIPEHGCDLFGYDIDKGCEAARERIGRHIAAFTAEAHIAVRRAFQQARVRA
jgi:hypothetical protein